MALKVKDRVRLRAGDLRSHVPFADCDPRAGSRTHRLRVLRCFVTWPTPHCHVADTEPASYSCALPQPPSEQPAHRTGFERVRRLLQARRRNQMRRGIAPAGSRPARLVRPALRQEIRADCLEPALGIEPRTYALRKRRSTTELCRPKAIALNTAGASAPRGTPMPVPCRASRAGKKKAVSSGLPETAVKPNGIATTTSFPSCRRPPCRPPSERARTSLPSLRVCPYQPSCPSRPPHPPSRQCRTP